MEQITEIAARLQPYVDAMTALCIEGRYAEYHIQNSSRSFSKRSFNRKTLKLWNIENAAGLRDVLDWFASDGMRKEFAETSGMLSVLSAEKRARQIEETEDPIQKHKLSVANQYVGRLSAGGIAAYDYSWGVFICCAARKMDYLTEEGKWDHIARFVGLAKESYSEWNDYMAGFAAGAVYSYGHKRVGYVADNQAVFAKLMFSRLSPFRKVRLS
ncbi:DUF1266 domain-containing protein [Paenibacillus sp. VCA1]|uniref:DUF1266 domain-containing protein n=1 Tax=Paenibacillus sp. VCA1 TaxID=3039148 RepID=UPI002870BB60|nr:DUF1266 domain-containing protein [Paenibacillus sp. VCA1]MDR9853910.1 DUF1266 domain-containing protein [Paenibacillus sp. VCA1]